jgi:hypothetical protein
MGEYCEYIFTGFFMLEALIKVISLEPRGYFRDGWNIFDFILVIGSFISLFISKNTSVSIKGTFTILRSFRVLRLLRLLKRARSLQLIFHTFVITLHTLANMGCLLLLFIFMYAIMGMILLGEIKRNDTMDDYINFEDFYNSALTLFVIASGDSWTNIMRSYAVEDSPSRHCLDYPTYEDYLANDEKTIGCGSKALAYSYFMSYLFIVNLIFLKIFIAVILEGYNSTQIQDGRLFNTEMNERFREIWA